MFRDLSEISRGGGGGHFKLGFGNEVTHPCNGSEFANPPLELGLKYHDPPHLTELKEKCSRLFKVQDSKPTRQTNEQEKKGNKAK